MVRAITGKTRASKQGREGNAIVECVYTGDCFRTPHIRSVTCAQQRTLESAACSGGRREHGGERRVDPRNAPASRRARSESARSRAVVA